MHHYPTAWRLHVRAIGRTGVLTRVPRTSRRSRRAMCRLRWLPSLAPHPSKIEKAPVCATQVVSIYGSRTSSIPLGLRDRRNPPDYKRAHKQGREFPVRSSYSSLPLQVSRVRRVRMAEPVRCPDIARARDTRPREDECAVSTSTTRVQVPL